MNLTLLPLTLALLTAQEPAARKDVPREGTPLAPSLILLSEKEEAAIERVIERFIQYETGKLKGKEAAKALADFKELGHEAVPQLIEGLNKSAEIGASCAAVMIASSFRRSGTSP